MSATIQNRSPFGEILRNLLDEHGITIRELARRMVDSEDFTEIESKRRMLQRYIRGDVQPNERVRHEIADAIPVDREVLAEDKDFERSLRRLHAFMLPLAEALLEIACDVRDRQRDAE